MNTKQQILDTAREWMNQHGYPSFNLRKLVPILGKSYGNITYHFPKQVNLIKDLYEIYQASLNKIREEVNWDEVDVLLELSRKAFRIQCDFLFFQRDYVEICRSYPDLAATIQSDNHSRIKAYRDYLSKLSDKSEAELDMIMQISGYSRAFFFMERGDEIAGGGDLESEYIKMNQYLASKL